MELYRLETGTSRLISSRKSIISPSRSFARSTSSHPRVNNLTSSSRITDLESGSELGDNPTVQLYHKLRGQGRTLWSREQMQRLWTERHFSNVEVQNINLQTVTTLLPIRNISSSRILFLRRMQPTMIIRGDTLSGIAESPACETMEISEASSDVILRYTREHLCYFEVVQFEVHKCS